MSACFLFPFLRAEWWYDRAAYFADEAKRAAKRQRQRQREQQRERDGRRRKRMSTPRERMRSLLAWGRTLLSPTPEQVAATGGEIGAGETASLFVQRIIRRWLFLGTITAITFYLWVIRDPIWHHSPADSWNYFLSWLAIAIESVVGMFFFGQSLRDGGVLRKSEAIDERLERMETNHGEMLTRLSAQVAALTALVEQQQGPAQANAVYEGRGKPLPFHDPDNPTPTPAPAKKASAPATARKTKGAKTP